MINMSDQDETGTWRVTDEEHFMTMDELQEAVFGNNDPPQPTTAERLIAYEKPFVDRVLEKQDKIGGAWERVFRLAAIYENDPSTTFQRYVIGAITMPKVGDVLKTNSDFEALPVDSVIKSADAGDKFYRRKMANGKWTHAEFEWGCDHKSFFLEYKVAFIPGESPLNDNTPEPDPIQDLADELWAIRNNTLEDMYDGDFFYQGKTPKHDEVYRALAEHVLGRFDRGLRPKEVLDEQGDTWTLRENGKYGLRGFCTNGSESYSDIEKYYGIAS